MPRSGRRFTRVRQVPVGNGVWSPDRAYVAEGRPECAVERPAADQNEPVSLDQPVDHFEVEAPASNIQWDSSTTVLVQGWHKNKERVFRCDVRSGACDVVDRAGWMALAEIAAHGG